MASDLLARLLVPRHALALVMLASALALGGAFALEHLAALPPCPLCIWQRWPHAAVIALGALGLVLRRPRPALGLAGLALAVGLGLAVYHVGVEQGWLALPAACEAAGGEAATVAELRSMLMSQPAPRCDQVAFTFAGLSLAGWNALLSLALSLLAASAALAARPAPASWRSGAAEPSRH